LPSSVLPIQKNPKFPAVKNRELIRNLFSSYFSCFQN
jgi:hypothetical protein